MKYTDRFLLACSNDLLEIPLYFAESNKGLSNIFGVSVFYWNYCFIVIY